METKRKLEDNSVDLSLAKKVRVSESDPEAVDKAVTVTEAVSKDTSLLTHVSKPAEDSDVIHSSKVAQHYNQLEETGLQARTQSRIFYMRNFNNWIKSMLIGDILQRIKRDGCRSRDLTVLDLCAGKGGDLLKWKKGQIGKLICADIAGTSVEQSESRYQDLINRTRNERYAEALYQAEFIAADCTRVRLRDHYKSPETKFNLTSCQFSFHYSFESYAQADIMMKNACECLKPGGYFIGTTPNSQEIVRRLRESPGMSYGNTVYEITFDGESKTDFPVFGAKYDFHLEGVVDCPEFLVHIPVLEKMASKYGMKLISTKRFDDIFTEFHDQGEGRALLGKMQSLEPYPAADDVELLGKEPGDYTHADNFLAARSDADKNGSHQDDRRRHELRVGTMSNAEWQAISLYLAFVFQKVKVDQESTSQSTDSKPSEPRSKSHENKDSSRSSETSSKTDEPS